MTTAALRAFRHAYNALCERVEGMPDDGLDTSLAYHVMCDEIEALSGLAFDDEPTYVPYNDIARMERLNGPRER